MSSASSSAGYIGDVGLTLDLDGGAALSVAGLVPVIELRALAGVLCNQIYGSTVSLSELRCLSIGDRCNMGGYGCLFAFIALLVWIAAEAISGLTVGHDISEVGYYWVFGISLALTVLLVNWRRNKSAKEKLDIQEGWLGDVARQRAEEKRKQEDTYASGLRNRRREADNVDKIVMGALKEVGLAYWGSVDKSWEVRRVNAGSPNVRWEVQDNADHYWSVWLTRSDSGDWRFGVTARGDTLYTSDTSAAEMKRVLRLAVERGPAFKS